MSFLETIACNSQEELTDWLGEKIGQLMDAHANYMANTLPLEESDVPLHAFLSTGLAKEILEDVDATAFCDFDTDYDAFQEPTETRAIITAKLSAA